MCRDMNDDGGLVSLLVRRVRLNVATCSTKSVYCRHVYDEVLLVSRRVRRGLVFLESGRVRGGLVIVWTCSARSV